MSIDVAEQLNGEIVACDSRTVYRHMDVGTAKPSLAERRGIAHYMFDMVDPDHSYTVAQYRKQAAEAIDHIFARGKTPIICGGTGFYAKALLEGLNIPPVPPQEGLRKELNEFAEREGSAALFQKLIDLDPVTAQRLNANDRFRVIRAIEVSVVMGKPFSQIAGTQPSPFNVIWIGLTADDRSYINRAISKRFDLLMEIGLLQEVEGLYRKYGAIRSLTNSVNYSEFLPYIDGKVDLTYAKDECLKHNNQLARRQLIWFRANQKIHWFSIDQYIDRNKMLPEVLSKINESRHI